MYMKKLVAHISNFFKFRELFFQLITRDIKLKYRRSVLGYFWSLLSPLLVIIVMILVFSQMFRFAVKNYPVYLVTGTLMFSFMQTSTSRAIGSIIDNAPLIKKTYVPKYIFTLASVTGELVNLAFALVALFIVILVTETRFTWYFPLALLPVIELYFFCIGLGLFLAQFAVFFRDIQHIWGVLTLAWMYLTPIFYPVDILAENLQFFVKSFNPMYYYLEFFRNCVMYDGIIRMQGLGYGAIAAALMLFLGGMSFHLNKNKFILYI
jgi:lipopolysaccharide transport system permease protein